MKIKFPECLFDHFAKYFLQFLALLDCVSRVHGMGLYLSGARTFFQMIAVTSPGSYD